MDLWVVILVGVLALLAGVALGFFIARKYMMNYLKKNPPINEQMPRMMMMQMGMKPSQKKINQMMKAMENQTK
nr:YneF family protein [Bacillus licheniformis]MDH3163523.1 YneF family protein [Bacillus licheniformis]